VVDGSYESAKPAVSWFQLRIRIRTRGEDGVAVNRTDDVRAERGQRCRERSASALAGDDHVPHLQARDDLIERRRHELRLKRALPLHVVPR
jgi:hypothetical protein